VRSSAPIALRYSVSIRAWVHTKLIRQIVLTVTWTESSLGAVHDGHERSAGRIRHDGRTNDSGCARRLVTVGRHFAVFPRGSTRRRALQHAARAQAARHDAFAVDGRDRCWPPNLYAAHRPTPPVAQAKTRRIAIVFRQRSDRVLVSSLLRPHAFPPGAGARLPLGLHIGV
jgi:hypothetical protein